MFSDIRKRSKKAGMPPGTLIYTGTNKETAPSITVVNYSATAYYEQTGADLEHCLPPETPPDSTTWINIDGLNNLELIKEMAKRYDLHPLTVEDILNIEQRSKIEEFENYIFITLKVLHWHVKKNTYVAKELSLIIGDHFILTFQDGPSTLFDGIRERLKNSLQQNLRKQMGDYLAYRIIDSVIDQYFLVLEALGDQIESVEEAIVANPTKEIERKLYHLKRQTLLLRKIIWPIREVVNHLSKIEGKLISPFTHIYLRDVYDHTAQALDSVEFFREMLSNMLDIYLSSITNRMNEIMKVLTIITTTFIPATFIASVYGTNFTNIPGLHWQWGFYTALASMICIIIGMLAYFRRRGWW